MCICAKDSEIKMILKPTPYVMKVLYCMEFYGHMHFTHNIQKLERLFE